MDGNLVRLAEQVRDLLEQHDLKIVLAESCTAGRIAATLGTIPGISRFLCGSFVIYRNDSKAKWLGIPREILDNPRIGPVSAEVTELLCESILKATPEADLGLGVTGDIGPLAPPETDGKVFLCIQQRLPHAREARCVQLHSPPPTDASDTDGRILRMNEATEEALQLAIHFLSGFRPHCGENPLET